MSIEKDKLFCVQSCLAGSVLVLEQDVSGIFFFILLVCPSLFPFVVTLKKVHLFRLHLHQNTLVLVLALASTSLPTSLVLV